MGENHARETVGRVGGWSSLCIGSFAAIRFSFYKRIYHSHKKAILVVDPKE